MQVPSEIIALLATGAALVLSPSQAPLRVLAGGDTSAPASTDPSNRRNHEMTRQPISNLPFARGRSFHTLDEYLAWREQLGAMDFPWYREVAPDIYELQTNMRPKPEKTRFTRAELERQFGFQQADRR